MGSNAPAPPLLKHADRGYVVFGSLASAHGRDSVSLQADSPPASVSVMARPTTRAALLDAAAAQYAKLSALIAGMSATEREAPLGYGPDFARPEAHWTRDRNLRDVVVHLVEWHRLFTEWATANRSGTEQPFLPAPYTWRTTAALNVEFWEQHQHTSLEAALDMLDESHHRVVALISEFSNTELFTKQHFPWTGTTSLGSYAVSATSSHYDWAIQKLRRHLRAARTAA